MSGTGLVANRKPNVGEEALAYAKHIETLAGLNTMVVWIDNHNKWRYSTNVARQRNISINASRRGKHMSVRNSLLESDSDIEEVTGTEPHEALTTNDHLDNDTEGNDDMDRLDLAPKQDNDSGPVVPPSEGGLTEDALLSLPVYTGDDDDELDEDLSTVADVDLAPTLGVQGHRLRETAEPQFPIPSQREGEPLLEATNKKDNFAVDTDPKLALTDEFAKDLNKYIPVLHPQQP